MLTIKLLLMANLCICLYQTLAPTITSNRGGPWDDNFGMINLLKNNSGWIKINDNDNNNNVNLSTMNNNNTTIVYNITIVNQNFNR
jgi:hypothetical protein